MKLLKELFSIYSPSGNEKKMRKFIKWWLRNNVPEAIVKSDKIGNIYVIKGEAENYPCLSAHIDQVQRIHSKDFEAIPIYTDPFVIVMPEDHPLAKEEEISLEELSAEPVVLFEEATRKEAYGILLEHEIQADIHYQSSDDPSILAMIERGMGLGYMGRLILTDTTFHVIAKKTDPQHFRHIALAIKDRKMAPRTALLFLEYVEENIAKYTKPIYEKNHM